MAKNTPPIVRKGLARLAGRYGWSRREFLEIAATLLTEPQVIERYWRNLAVATKAGYTQSAENGYLTLPEWCRQRGWLDPCTHDFTLGTTPPSYNE